MEIALWLIAMEILVGSLAIGMSLHEIAKAIREKK